MTAAGGTCSVDFDISHIPAGTRTTVLAYVEGNKGYEDINNDNQYTEGTDKLTDNIGAFFRDDNENGVLDSNEFLYRSNGSTVCAGTTAFSVQPNIANTCNTQLSATLRKQFVVVK